MRFFMKFAGALVNSKDITVYCTDRNGGKRSLRNVFWSDLELKISSPQVNLGEDTCTIHLIKQILNPREEIFVLDSDFV